MDEKVLNKISKLLALGEGQANQEEADSALAKAYALMQEYNIDRSDIDNANKDAVLGELDEQKLIRTPMVVWEQRLLASIAHLFDCEVLRNERRGMRGSDIQYYIIGREGNRATVKVMYDWIRHKIDRDKYKVFPASARVGYCLGVVDEIGLKASALKKDNVGKKDAWGIVPIDEVQAWMNAHYGKLGSHKNVSSAVDWSAYGKGRADGKDINLNKQVQRQALPTAV